MNTVWLLFKEMDYESAAVHSVYNDKPDIETLAGLIKDSFGYVYDSNAVKDLAKELHNDNNVRLLSNYTWELEERYVV